MSEFDVKELMCEIGRRTYQNGFVAANDGNFTVKLAENEFFCTAANVSKGFMTHDMILRVDGEGRLLEPQGEYAPSSEIKMHMIVYKVRSDVNAVVHAHPPLATAHAVCGMALTSKIMPEFLLMLREVPLTDYGTPSTFEIPQAIEEAVKEHDAILLSNHGAVSMGKDLMQAYFRMESLEYWAKMNLYTKLLGGAREIAPEQVAKIAKMRVDLGMAAIDL